MFNCFHHNPTHTGHNTMQCGGVSTCAESVLYNNKHCYPQLSPLVKNKPLKKILISVFMFPSLPLGTKTSRESFLITDSSIKKREMRQEENRSADILAGNQA